MNDTTREYTVILRPEGEIDDTLLVEIRDALEAIEGASVHEIETGSALGLDRRELFITALVSFGVTVSANLTSGAIQAVLDRRATTRALVVEEVVAEEPAEISPVSPPATDNEP